MQSPCKNCKDYNMPQCMKNCDILESFQESIKDSYLYINHNYLETEEYYVSKPITIKHKKGD